MTDLTGKVAVVLGAGGKDNMGQAIARRLAGAGAKVLITGRQQAPLAELAAEIGGDWMLCDIAKKADVEAYWRARQ